MAKKSTKKAPPERKTYPGSDDINLFADLLKLSAEELGERVKDDADNPIPEEKVAGLLKLERSGQNRTDHIQVLMDRLGVKSPYEVTNAGPAYTNDTTPVTKLER